MPAPRRQLPLAETLLTTGKPLPALFPTTTPDLSDLHAKLYNLLALILRAYLQQWYSRLSPRDRTLLPTITTLISQSLPPLLQADRELLTTLLLSDLPVILTTHTRTYWAAKASLEITPCSLDAAYHARLPLPSVSLQSTSTPVAVSLALAEALAEPLSAQPPAEEETYALSPLYLTALSDSLLALHLPAVDYASDAERLIVREVLARAVLANIGKKLSAPWFWAELGIKLIPERQAKQPRTANDTLLRLYSILSTSLLFLWSAGHFLVAEFRSSPTPSRRRVIDPWLALLRALVETTQVPIYISLALLLLESIALLASPVLDRLLPHLLDRALSPKTCIKLIDLVERILFPNGWPVPSIDPTPEEAIELDIIFRKRVKDRGLPPHLIDTISDPGCNAHLVGMLYNAIVAALVPQLVVN